MPGDLAPGEVRRQLTQLGARAQAAMASWREQEAQLGRLAERVRVGLLRGCRSCVRVHLHVQNARRQDTATVEGKPSLPIACMGACHQPHHQRTRPGAAFHEQADPACMPANPCCCWLQVRSRLRLRSIMRDPRVAPHNYRQCCDLLLEQADALAHVLEGSSLRIAFANRWVRSCCMVVVVGGGHGCCVLQQ